MLEDADDVRRNVRGTDEDDNEENPVSQRGVDVSDKPWQQPSRQEARRYGRATVFGNGCASVWNTTPLDFAPLGEGVTLYFLLLQWFAWFFVAQTLVSLPSLVLFASGGAILEQQLDLFDISTTTLGNLHADNITAWLARYHTTYSEDVIANLTASDALGTPSRPFQMSYFISAMDMVNTCFFFAFILWLKHKMSGVAIRANQRFVSTSDYAVYVQGLPADATESEVREHFDRLYQLKEPDWSWPGYFFGLLGRKVPRDPPGHRQLSSQHRQMLEVRDEGLEPVRDTSHIRDPSYEGSWVCEVTLARNQRDIVRTSLARRASLMRMNEVRAAIRKYETPKHANAKLRLAAKAQLKELEGRVEAAQGRIAKLQEKKGDQACSGAFVIFQHQESRKRCLEDYRTYSRWWHKLPTPLRFRNGKYALRVKPAPEPTNIKWESQGVGPIEAWARQCLVALAVLVILLGTFTLVYWCQAKFRDLRARLPDADLCIIDIPAMLLGSYNLVELSPKLERRPDLDAHCESSTFWLGYPAMAESDAGLLSYNASDPCSSPCVSWPGADQESACYTLSVEEGCPSTEDPLEAANLDAICALTHETNATDQAIVIDTELLSDPDALARLVRAVDSVHCCRAFFKSRTMRACYCAQRLRAVVKQVGIFRALGVVESEDGSVCADEASDMLYAQLMGASPAIVVSVVNALIRTVMSRITRLENHATVTDQDMSIALKIFATQFITTALVMLVINAARTSGPSLDGTDEVFVDSLGNRIFAAGDFEDFTRAWYAVVGQAIILAMGLNVITVQLYPVFLGYVIAPMRRLYYSAFALTQERLNWAFRGLKFGVTVRYAMLTNTIWVTMLYSASMPLVLPCAALFFACTYWFDKYAILRYYHRPPAYDASFPLLVVRMLPMALLGHAGFSFWALANDDLVPSQKLSWAKLEAFFYSDDASADTQPWADWADWVLSLDHFGVASKASHLAALPQFIMAVVILSYYVTYAVLHTFYLLPRLTRAVVYLLRIAQKISPIKGKRVHPRNANIAPEKTALAATQDLPPFTNHYVREVPPKTELSALQRKLGWHLVHQEDVGRTFEYCTWQSDGQVAKLGHLRGDIMKTWQIISTQSVHSYRLEYNPFYKL